jgi:DHA2 family multidrug resistance protein
MAFQTMAQGHGAGNAETQVTGLALIYQALMAQAAALSYLDAYMALGAASVAMFFLSFLLKSNNPRKAEQHSGH